MLLGVLFLMNFTQRILSYDIWSSVIEKSDTLYLMYQDSRLLIEELQQIHDNEDVKDWAKRLFRLADKEGLSADVLVNEFKVTWF